MFIKGNIVCLSIQYLKKKKNFVFTRYKILVANKAPPGLRTSEFRVPSSEPRGKEERKTEGGEHPSSE